MTPPDAIAPDGSEIRYRVGDARTAYPQCLRILAADPAIDVVALATDTVEGAFESPTYAEAVAQTARQTHKPWCC